MTERNQYFRMQRKDVDAVLPNVGGNWLEIGAAELVFARRVIKQRDLRRYDYIEPHVNSDCADEELHKVADSVEAWSPAHRLYDVVIALDVIEHIVDTDSLLDKIVKALRVGGFLVLSVPNVSHYSVIRRLMQGDFQYTESGLLDKTHVRFFTPKSVNRLLTSANFVRTEHVFQTRKARPCSILQTLRCYQYLSVWRLEDKIDEPPA